MKNLLFLFGLTACLFTACAGNEQQGIIREAQIEGEVTVSDSTYGSGSTGNGNPFTIGRKTGWIKNGSKCVESIAMGDKTMRIYKDKDSMCYVLFYKKDGSILEIDSSSYSQQDESLKEYDVPMVREVNETKTIAGYECKKAILTYNTNGKYTVIDCWYTFAIEAGWQNSFFYRVPGIQGFIMQLGSYNDEAVTFTVTKVTPQKVDDSRFMLPAE